MKSYDLYVKIALVLVGVFWLWDWGQEGSQTLSPCALALADSSSVFGTGNAVCDSIYLAILDSMISVEEDDGEWMGFEPSTILIRLKGENEVGEALFAAGQAQETATGVASFDAISQKHGLICLLPLGVEGWRWYKRDFKLLFPLELDVVDFVAAYIAYEKLPYVEFADLEGWGLIGKTPPYSALSDSVQTLLDRYYIQAKQPDPSAILDHSWGHIKTHQKNIR